MCVSRVKWARTTNMRNVVCSPKTALYNRMCYCVIVWRVACGVL